jgi:uncharacterized repeat protein (TIGR03803 family)
MSATKVFEVAIFKLNIFRQGRRVGSLLALTAISLATASVANAGNSGFKTLYNFTGGSDGSLPLASLITDKAGNFYGTTLLGGTHGAGTVFKLSPKGVETTLYSFANGNDGFEPIGGLVADKAGNLYGTTQGGGNSQSGTVFKVTASGAETVLYTFTGGSDGGAPRAGLIMDKAGNLYGTTLLGGKSGNGAGVVFKLAPDGTETVIHTFTGLDGAGPEAGLIQDKAGNLYGTTPYGGANDWGTVFKVAPDGTETVLYSFADGSDGATPLASVMADKAGNLFGTASGGGAFNNGVVFELTPDGTETALYAFTGGNDGGLPAGNVISDKDGNLYGTTRFGGAMGEGVVFELAPDGSESVLHTFAFAKDGAQPVDGLIMISHDLYGTAQEGGADGEGVVFKLKS